MCSSAYEHSHSSYSNPEDISALPSLSEREQSDTEATSYPKVVSWIRDTNHLPTLFLRLLRLLAVLFEQEGVCCLWLS